ncbi:MAG: dephospho-CoA kinase [Burkholderiales bacterium]|nr:dephospho-CoA kinase [Burkholderiales bacterium]
MSAAAPSTPATRSFLVGLTGGIGSGKSSAANRFAELGAYVIDADAISHALTAAGGAALPEIAAAFPGVVTDGVLDRGALREVVFASSDARKRLEHIIHPKVRQRTNELMRCEAATKAPYVIHMVPLLFESADYATRIDCAIVVDVDEATQIERVSTLRGVPAATVRAIINAQMPRSERLRRTQFVLDNTSTLAQLHDQVDRLHTVLVANARWAHRVSGAARAPGEHGTTPDSLASTP